MHFERGNVSPLKAESGMAKVKEDVEEIVDGGIFRDRSRNKNNIEGNLGGIEIHFGLVLLFVHILRLLSWLIYYFCL